MQIEFQFDPFSPSLFVFYNREHNKLKILFWEHNGIGLFYRHLERGHSNRRAAEKEYLIRCRKRSSSDIDKGISYFLSAKVVKPIKGILQFSKKCLLIPSRDNMHFLNHILKLKLRSSASFLFSNRVFKTNVYLTKNQKENGDIKSGIQS